MISFHILLVALVAMVAKRWDPSSSCSSSSESLESSDELEVLSDMSPTQTQKDYLEIGDSFLKAAKLDEWFLEWDPSTPFNYTSDCSLSITIKMSSKFCSEL